MCSKPLLKVLYSIVGTNEIQKGVLLTLSVPGFFRKWPKIQRKKTKFPNFGATFRRSRNVAKPACQVDSDSKFNVDYDALVYFAQKRREMP